MKIIFCVALMLLTLSCSNRTDTTSYSNRTDTTGTASASVRFDNLKILKNADGSTRLLTQEEAMTACPNNMHLPSIQELAAFAKAQGAKGILKMNEVDPRDWHAPPGYINIRYSSIDLNPSNPSERWVPWAKEDLFYFSMEGFVSPLEKLDNWIWSKSASGNHEESGWAMSSSTSYIEHQDKDAHLTVLCFSGPSVSNTLRQWQNPRTGVQYRGTLGAGSCDFETMSSERRLPRVSCRFPRASDIYNLSTVSLDGKMSGDVIGHAETIDSNYQTWQFEMIWSEPSFPPKWIKLVTNVYGSGGPVYREFLRVD